MTDSSSIRVDARLLSADPGPRLNKNLYGHFAEHLGRCIYEGVWVGEDSSIPNRRGMRTDVLSALRRLNIPVLRWPGGCFADEYRWEDGVGPRAERPRRINTHWGGVLETNQFGTHEFMELGGRAGRRRLHCGQRRHRHATRNARVGRVHDRAARLERGRAAP
ncbi:MAG: hypothetical protein QM756_03020 [Polyangiaceae bacterium]